MALKQYIAAFSLAALVAGCTNPGQTRSEQERQHNIERRAFEKRYYNIDNFNNCRNIQPQYCPKKR